MIEETIVEQGAWGDLHLRFASEEEANKVLADYTGSVDVIGVIDGVEGWHVNTRGVMTNNLLPYSIEVATPIRVWA